MKPEMKARLVLAKERLRQRRMARETKASLAAANARLERVIEEQHTRLSELDPSAEEGWRKRAHDLEMTITNQRREINTLRNAVVTLSDVISASAYRKAE